MRKHLDLAQELRIRMDSCVILQYCTVDVTSSKYRTVHGEAQP